MMKRHIKYEALVKSIHDHIVEAFTIKTKIFKALGLKEEGGEKKAEVKIQAKMIKKLEAGGHRNLGKCSNLQNFQSITKAHPRAREIQDLLRQMRCKACKEDEEGTSWLEMYVLYKMTGGPECIPKGSNNALARPSMKMQVKDFQTYKIT